MLSRHTYCAKFVSDILPIYMDVMPTADGKGWEPYKKAAGRAHDICNVGTARLTTNFSAYGLGNGLSISHSMDTRLSNVTLTYSAPGAKCPAAIGAMTVQPTFSAPNISTVYYGQPTGLAFSYPKPSLSLTIANGSTASASIPLSVSWQPAATRSVLSFFFLPEKFQYSVGGAETPTGVPQQLSPGGTSGPNLVPVIRCDVFAVTNNQSGCILPDAAAVYVVDSALYPEAGAHIREAIAGTSIGMTGKAPGGFVLLDGTRAVGVDGPGSLPLQRSDVDTKNANRAAACGNAATSLVRTRPAGTSASCAGSVWGNVVPGCQCDEYPFAASMSGAAVVGGGTVSVKYIQKTDNQESGSLLGAFYNNERIVKREFNGAESWWVYVK